MAVTRPIVRYHGGKWRLAPWIISTFPAHRVYVEPFGGGGSVLLRKERSYAEIYNDLDGTIVNLFRVVRDQGEELKRLCYLTPFAKEEYELTWEASDDLVEQARRTVFRSFAGFGSNSLNDTVHSGFRASSNRSGTTPAHDWANWPDTLSATIERLRGVVIENRDACEVMAAHDGPETLHYVDPPYVHSTRMAGAGNGHQNHGYKYELTDEQHRSLGMFLHGLKGMVVLSGYDCPLYQELFGDWHSMQRTAMADGARERTETLWLSPAAVAAGQLHLGL
jgi:DNA adenine methylase